MKKFAAFLFGLALLAVGCSEPSEASYGELSKYAFKDGTAIFYVDGSRFEGNEVVNRASEIIRQRLLDDVVDESDSLQLFSELSDQHARVLISLKVDGEEISWAVVGASEKFPTVKAVKEACEKIPDLSVAEGSVSGKPSITLSYDSGDDIEVIECGKGVLVMTPHEAAGAYLAAEKGVAPELAKLVEPLRDSPSFSAGIISEFQATSFDLKVDCPDNASLALALTTRFENEESLEETYKECVGMVAMYSMMLASLDPDIAAQLQQKVKFSKEGDAMKCGVTVDLEILDALEKLAEEENGDE